MGLTLRILHEINLRYNPKTQSPTYWFSARFVNEAALRYRRAFRVALQQEAKDPYSRLLRIIAMCSWPYLRLRWDIYWAALTGLAPPGSIAEMNAIPQFIWATDPSPEFQLGVAIGRLSDMDELRFHDRVAQFQYSKETIEAYNCILEYEKEE